MLIVDNNRVFGANDVCLNFDVIRPGNVYEFRSETTSCECMKEIFASKSNLEFLLVYYTGHTWKDKQLEICLQKVSVFRLVCIIDCCRADEVRLIPDTIKGCRRVVLRSSEGTAKASPTAGSTFTRYYLAGLRSAIKCPCKHGVQCSLLKQFREKSLESGFVTLANLFDYAAEHMGSQKPRQEVVSYRNGNNVLAFFNREPIVYSLQFVRGNKRHRDVEIEEQMIDFNASVDDICEQLVQEVLRSSFSYGLYMWSVINIRNIFLFSSRVDQTATVQYAVSCFYISES